MAGFGTILDKPIHDRFAGHIVNTHPALLPAFKGWHAVDDALAGRAYLLGDQFTAADIMMGYTLMIYRRLVTPELPTNLERYWSRLSERPAFRATMAANEGS